MSSNRLLSLLPVIAQVLATLLFDFDKSTADYENRMPVYYSDYALYAR